MYVIIHFYNCHNHLLIELVVNRTRFRYYSTFPRGTCNATKYNSYDILKIFGKHNLSFRTLSDLSCLVLPNPVYRETLRRLGFDVPDKSLIDRPNGERDNYLRGQIARILLTPNAEISQAIYRNLRKRGAFQHVMGAQLRTGGSLANTKEWGKFLGLSTLESVGPCVQQELQRRGWEEKETILFLSADSGLAYHRVESSLQGRVKVLTGEGFRAGHSSPYLSGGRHLEYLKRAIMDLVLLSQSEFLIVTYRSSYGTLAMRLALHNQTFILSNPNV